MIVKGTQPKCLSALTILLMYACSPALIASGFVLATGGASWAYWLEAVTTCWLLAGLPALLTGVSVVWMRRRGHNSTPWVLRSVLAGGGIFFGYTIILFVGSLMLAGLVRELVFAGGIAVVAMLVTWCVSGIMMGMERLMNRRRA